MSKDSALCDVLRLSVVLVPSFFQNISVILINLLTISAYIFPTKIPTVLCIYAQGKQNLEVDMILDVTEFFTSAFNKYFTSFLVNSFFF